MSKRKPHNNDVGYIPERIFSPSRAHIVIYAAQDAEIDAGGDKYAVVCSKHSTVCGETSMPRARILMKYLQFCEEYMASRNHNI